MRKHFRTAAALLLAVCITPVSAGDTPKNLQVLPDSIDGETLSSVMKGFTAALGVRCSFCHVGEEHQPLSEYDFVSDERYGKNVARKMMRLTGTVNAAIGDIFHGGTGTPVTVQCVTCHRGLRVPKKVDDVLWEEYQQGGIPQSLQWFRDARKKYYGGIAYDFSERTLLQFARRFEQPDSALQVVEANREYFPDSPYTLTTLASLYADAGRDAKARSLVETVLKNDPGNERAQRLQERLKKK